MAQAAAHVALEARLMQACSSLPPSGLLARRRLWCFPSVFWCLCCAERVVMMLWHVTLNAVPRPADGAPLRAVLFLSFAGGPEIPQL